MSRNPFPLSWPEHWPRTEKRGSSQFRTTLSGALSNVQEEIRRFGKDSGRKVTELLISSNVTLSDQRPADPGVAIWFEWDGISSCIAVDRYEKVEDNLQAIAKVIEAERTKLRHGGLNVVRAAFTGYMKLPPPQRSDWWTVLGVRANADRATIEAAYKRLRSQHHPDHGGDATKFHEVQQAYEEATA